MVTHRLRCVAAQLTNFIDATKRQKLEEAGWKLGTTQEFLGLSEIDVELIELKLALSNLLKESRARHQISQDALAKKMG